MPDRTEIDRAIQAVFSETDLQRAGLAQRLALKLLDHGVWEGTVTPFYQARAEQRINTWLRTLWHEVTVERLRQPRE
jgi:lipase chaperone LimK